MDVRRPTTRQPGWRAAGRVWCDTMRVGYPRWTPRVCSGRGVRLVSPDNAARQPSPRASLRAVHDLVTLDAAWRRIRGNAHSPSASKQTRAAVGEFELSATRELALIQRQIREERFEFRPQEGRPIRREGKTPRPIVLAPVRNRVVQRAILQVLQRDVRIAPLLHTRHSFGGIEGRGVASAMAEVAKAIDAGMTYFYRSDIRDFFTGIPRSSVVRTIGARVRDRRLMRLLEAGLATNLANLDELTPDERALFPLGKTGVAQGSPLSAFVGNVLLAPLDEHVNAGNVRFIRYIDDLLVLARSRGDAERGFELVRAQLTIMGFTIYGVADESKGKASTGDARSESFEFLGTLVSKGLLQPAVANRKAFLARIEKIIDDGRRRLVRIARSDGGCLEGGLARVLSDLDHQVRGTARAFKHCNCPQLWKDLDKQVDGKLRRVFGAYARLRSATTQPEKRRRLLGVTPLIDLNGDSWAALVARSE